jgi:hypothetical protein
VYRTLHLSLQNGQYKLHKTLTPECLRGYQGSLEVLLEDAIGEFQLDITLGGVRLLRSGDTGLYYQVWPRQNVLEQLQRSY